MPCIQPTRKRTLANINQDRVQSSFHFHEQKRVFAITPDPSPTTITLAQDFLRLEDTDRLVQCIKQLYNNISFSSRQFIDYIIKHHAGHLPKLLSVYYSLSTQLDVLALRLEPLISQIPRLDQVLCELISFEERHVIQAYIRALDTKTLDDYFYHDGKQLVDWRQVGVMKSEHTQRLWYILEYYHVIMDSNQLKSILIQLMQLNPTQDSLYQQLRKVKETLFMPQSKLSSKQYDALLAKLPVFHLMSTWFFEFNPQSTTHMSDFVSHLFSLHAMENQFDISLILYMYHAACKQLVADRQVEVRVSYIIETLNEAAWRSLEKDDTDELAMFLQLAQVALEHMHPFIGYTYASWFDTLFVHQRIRTLNKRMGTLFINMLHQMMSFEIPSVLQIHGKALLNCTTLPNASLFVSAVRKRLLELGVDHTLKAWPTSLKLPVPADNHHAVDTIEVGDVLTKFIEKDGAIPAKLIQATVFHKSWSSYESKRSVDSDLKKKA
ncbi:uncharacterized protein B0P05DRAFT_591099 [Gilbertella persicaria]|uniref:uncharacterized protein n=1 Tax=Gilbertella persicaria TaxID=101096 RepID=UPI00221EB1DC|nr:uncharacterized protein B0P05DRAFT_591099 [Gilbertella persicaria]KAI8058944.1 hypothetical protein B0P05DRAFT_591099 [Gilbertella persicaria]